MNISENQIDVNGLTVHYYEAGDAVKPTILMLHGHVGDAWLHWADVMPLFVEKYHCLAPDMPGYGGSSRLPKLTPETMAQWGHDFLMALNIPDAVVIGNSFNGGLMARIMAANYPKVVPALVLVNGGTIPRVPGCARAIASIPAVGGFIYGRIAKGTVKPSELVGNLVEREGVLNEQQIARITASKKNLAYTMRSMSLMPKPQNRKPAMPVLLLWGEEDAITPRVFGEGLNQHISGSQLELIAHTRHVPHIEDVDTFSWQVQQFLAQINPNVDGALL